MKKKRIAIYQIAWMPWSAGLVALSLALVVSYLMFDTLPDAIGLAVIAAAWIVAALFLSTALDIPIYSAFLESSGTVSFIWQYPHKRLCKTCYVSEVPEPEISTHKSSDGDHQFTARLIFSDGAEFILEQPIVRTNQTSKTDAKKLKQCEDACAQFLRAIYQQS